MKHNYRIIIVGSGLAGLAAADILSRYGLGILVIDDNAHIGGQLLRKPPHTGSGGKRFRAGPAQTTGGPPGSTPTKRKYSIPKGRPGAGHLSGTHSSGARQPGACV